MTDLPDEKLSKTKDATNASRVCIYCCSDIYGEAIKCPQCQSFQNYRRWINFFLPIFGIFAALIAASPIVYASILLLLEDYELRYSVLSFSAQNVVDNDGDILTPPVFGVTAQIYNLGSRPLIIDDAIECNLRDALVESRKIVVDGEDYSLQENVFDFQFYIEKPQHQVIAPGATENVGWFTNNSISLELYGYSYGAEPNSYYESEQYEVDETEQFYGDVVERLSKVAAKWPNVEGQRTSSLAEDGLPLQSFFSNLDCFFELTDGTERGHVELHLEFLYEHDAPEGLTPRWRIGKNIGFGYGNGAGNGSD